MVREEQYFYISGFIALSIFFVFSLLFAKILFDANLIKKYGLKKENFVSISLNTVNIPEQKQIIKSSTPQFVPAKTQEVSKNIDVNDLFSDVWTQKIDHTNTKPKEINSKRIQEIAKRVKNSEDNDVESISEKLNSLDASSASKEKQSTSSADEVNEYLAKIQALVYENFNPPANSEGNVVKIVIELDALGKMLDLRILNYSSHDGLNQEADRIKERLRSMIFPKNPEHKSFRAIINLIPENKD